MDAFPTLTSVASKAAIAEQRTREPAYLYVYVLPIQQWWSSHSTFLCVLFVKAIEQCSFQPLSTSSPCTKDLFSARSRTLRIHIVETAFSLLLLEIQKFGRHTIKMTPWRDKYGSAQFDWDSEKSGFTPLDLIFPGGPLDPASEECRRREIIEAFQGDKLRGYTSMELVQLDAITVREMKPDTLNLPIIPLLQRTRWEKTPSKQHARTQMYP